MNDFTKEELIALKNGIDYLTQSVNLDCKYQELCNHIFKKLETMIDNYCDHEWHHTKSERKYYRCSKCLKPSLTV